MIRRKRPNIALGASRMYGLSGIRLSDYKYVFSGFGFATATTPTLTMLTAGDLLLVHFQQRSNTPRNVNLPTSTGMTFNTISNTGAFNDRPYLWYGWVPDSTPRDVTVTLSGGTGNYLVCALVYRPIDATTPLDVVATPGTYTASLTPSIPGITTTTDRAWAFCAISSSDNNNINVTSSGWTRDFYHEINGNSCAAVAHKEFPVAGPTGAIDWQQDISGPDNGEYVNFALRVVQG